MGFRLLVLFGSVVSIYCGPAGLRSQDSLISTCATTCTGSSKFRYSPGTTYTYKYEGDTKTSMTGASEDHSTIGITAVADLEVQSKCELVLKVRDVTLFAFDSRKYENQDSSGKFAEALAKHPLRFSFQDGRIVSVCPHAQEETWAVNIKKGILSALQNSMDNFDIDFKGTENDVTGQCETDYKIAQRGWKSIMIKKSKDLLSCSHRQGFDSAIQTAPIRVSSGMKSLPVMKSTHTCDQEVSTQGILTTSQCHELHVFQPFSKENSGATTEVTQKLAFVQERQTISTQSASSGKPEELYFRHGPTDKLSDLSAKEGLAILQSICDGAIEVTPATSRQFSTLVSAMKRMDFANLQRVYSKVNKDNFCTGNTQRVRKFMFDAIPMVGTGASIELMKTLISNNDIQGSLADMWVASLAFVDHPTKEMIRHVQELFGMPSLSTKVILPLSAMVHSYCRVNPDCAEVQEVKDVIEMIKKNLQSSCQVNQQNFRTIMMSLRALGNIGHADMLVPSLTSCITEADNPMDIRVAAIQGYRRLSCAADRNNLMVVFNDSNQDSELRITAYQALMVCPSPEFIRQIMETLTKEEVNQVGSFVWSHLTNLMESSDPSNKYVQSLLNDQKFVKEFDLDKMKFSRNYEGSFFMDRWNTGAKVDSNLVWSSKSFIPRSATLNLTVNMFGESMNLLELGGRVEGLEQLLESYFGPQGYYNNNEKGSNEIPDADPQHARLSVDKFKNIKKQAKMNIDALRGAMYMRMFGTEISYNMFGTNNGNNDDSSSSGMLNILQKLRNNEPQDISFTKNFMFVDSTYTLPTVVGLPLKLTVNGSATVALNVQGNIDVKSPRDQFAIEGKFEPSGAVELDCMMSIDAVVTRGGLKMVSTLYTITGAQGKIKLVDGNVFEFNFDLTKDKQEILNLKSSFFIVYNDYEKIQKMVIENRQEKDLCTAERLTKWAGVQFCAGISLPHVASKTDSPRFPFNGPLAVSVTLNKKDLPNGYKLEVKTIKTSVQTLFRFMSDTPGSKENRGIGFDIDLQHDLKSLEVNLISPWKNATLKGELTDTAMEKRLLCYLDIDEATQLYKLDAKFQINQNKDQTIYTPLVLLQVPNWKSIQLSGVINYNFWKTFNVDLTVSGAMDTDIVLKSSVWNTDTQVGMTSMFNYNKSDGYVFEALSKCLTEEKKSVTYRTYNPRFYIKTPDEEIVEITGQINVVKDKSMKADLQMTKLTKKPVTLKADWTVTEPKRKNKSTKYEGDAFLNGPDFSTKLTISGEHLPGKTIIQKTTLNYHFGKTLTDIITATNRIDMDIAESKQKIVISSDINSKTNDLLDNTLVINYAKSRDATNMDLTLKYGQTMKEKTTKDRVDFSMAVIHKERGGQYNSNYTVSLKFPAKSVDLMLTGDSMYNNESVSGELKIQYHPDRVVSFGVRLHNKTRQFHNYAGALTVSLPQERQMSFSAGFGKESEDRYISNLEFEIIKGRRTRIDTILKIATEKIYEFEVGVQLPDLEPVRILGSYATERNSYTVQASCKKAEKVYRIMTQVLHEQGKAGKLMLNVTIPERNVLVIVGASQVKTERHALVDIQWNADKNIDDRFLSNVTIDYKSMDDFEVSSTLHYPSRTVNFSIKHSSAARYITNVKLSWNPTELLEFNIIFRDDEFHLVNRTELTVEFKSPFKGYEELGLAASLIRDSTHYQTKSSVTWAKKKKILVSATAKIPLEINSVDIVGQISTPFSHYESMAALVKHRFNNGVQSWMQVTWGKNKLSVNTSGQLELTGTSKSFNCKVDLRTPFEGLRDLVLNVQHSDDYSTFKLNVALEATKFSVQADTDKYSMDMVMNRDSNTFKFSNKGTLQILIPNDDIKTTWEVNKAAGSTKVMLDILPIRGNRFKILLEEMHQLLDNRYITTKFELMIPTESVREIQASFTHEDRQDFVNTVASVKKDNLEILSGKVYYQKRYGSLELDSTFISIYTEDIVVKMSSIHSLMPYRSNIEMKWGDTPYKIIANSELFYNEFGKIEGLVHAMTPIPNANKIEVSVSRQMSGLNWVSNLKFSLNGQQYSIDTIDRFNHVKLFSFSLMTPHPQFSGIYTSFKVDGNLMNFKGDTSFAVLPYFSNITANFNWAYFKEATLNAAFNLTTPFPQYPYMRIKMDSLQQGISRVSSFEMEYMPTMIAKVEADYRFTSLDKLQGTVKITSPYTNNHAVVAAFVHTGNMQEFRTKSDITCNCFKNQVLVDAMFSSKNEIIGTFDMKSPFRGYETVKWNLKHQGTFQSYRTKMDYETNGKIVSYENIFNMTDKINLQVTFLTPFENLSRAHLLFTHTGAFPNIETHAEAAYNEKLIKSDINLSHNQVYTKANAVVMTPFARYENVKATISKTGSLNDFIIVANLQYDLNWHASLQNKWTDLDLFTSAIVRSPFMQDNVSIIFNHTGDPMNFETMLEYTLGPNYQSTCRTRFLYNLPNVIATTQVITVIGTETRTNAVSLEHSQKISKLQIDIKSKFVAQIREQKANINVELFFVPVLNNINQLQNYSAKILAVAEIPHPSFSYNKLFYLESLAQYADVHLGRSEFSFESPHTKKIYRLTEAFVQGSKSKLVHEGIYGDTWFSSVLKYEPGMINYNVTTSLAGYEETNLDIYYSASSKDNSIKLNTLKINGSLTSSALQYPIQMSAESNVEFEQSLKSMAAKLKVSYNNTKEILTTAAFKPGSIKFTINLPFNGYESSALQLSYSSNFVDISASSSALSAPVTLLSKCKYVDIFDMEHSMKFTSGWTKCTHLEAIVKTSRISTDTVSHVKLVWEDKVLLVEGKGTWNVQNLDNAEAGAGLIVQSPYPQLADLNVNFKHKHFTSPMRAKDLILVQYNNNKYFDFDAEFSALNNFSGVISFRAPKPMEFSFSGLNEGESVNADLILNWNKLEKDSNFRLEFGLADKGDLNTEKKVFNIKIINPGRIMSLENTYERNNDKFIGSGKVSWDQQQSKEASYEFNYSKSKSRGVVLHSTNAKLVVPTRKIEMLGSYTEKGNQMIGTSELLWDADNDKDKKVEVKVTVVPVELKKIAQLNIKLPSIKKEFSVNTELTLSKDLPMLDGKMKFTYAPEDKKAVVLSYVIDGSKLFYRAGWSLDHEYTNTHIEMSTRMSNKDAISSGDVELKFYNSNNDMVTLAMKGSLDTNNRQMNIKFLSDGQSSELTGQMTAESPYVVTLETLHNATPTWKSVWRVNMVDRTLDISMTYDGMKSQVITRAFFPNDTSFVSETSKQSGSVTVPRGRLLTELHDRKLHGHLKWHPQLIKEVTEFSSATLHQMVTEMSPIVESSLKEFGELMLKKSSAINKSLKEELAPVWTNIETTVRAAQQDLRLLKQELRKMYQQNELYMKTIEETYSSAVKSVLDGYSSSVIHVNNAYTKVSDAATQLTNKLDHYSVKENYSKMMASITEYIQTNEASLLQRVDLLIKLWTKWLEEMSKFYDDTMKDLSQQFKKLFEVILAEYSLTPYLSDVETLYNDMQATYRGIKDENIVHVQKLLNQVHQLLIDSLEQSTLAGKYQVVSTRAKDIIRNQFGVMENEDVKNMLDALLNLHEQTSWIYEYTQIETSLKDLTQQALNKIKSRIMEEFNQLPLGLLDIHKSRVTHFDLENGEIQFDLYLPIPMKNFDEMMRFTVDKYVTKLKKIAENYFPRHDICLWDFYYRLPHVQLTMRKDWVPPFDVFGTVSGKQHFTTFDGHHYDVAGLCSYILVQDMMNNNFSVVLKYTGTLKSFERDSIITMVAGKTIEMFRNYMVRIDGQPSELPYRSDGLTVVRSGNQVLLESATGLGVISDFISDYHIVSLSGWYFGKVGGLLGSYDNEINNDIAMPNGEVDTRYRRFLNAWEVDNTCKNTNDLAESPASDQSPICSEVFGRSNSSLRPCFLQVLPESYRHNCDMKPSALCDIATLYVQMCARQGITVTIPASCVKCSSYEKKDFGVGETLKYRVGETLKYTQDPETVPDSMDVVIVIEERQCNRDMAEKLKDIVYKLEHTLSQSGTKGNMYSLVGYSGSLVYTHTMEGRIFNEATKFAMGLENVQFTSNAPDNDPQAALVYSATLPFRIAVRKTIILVSCSPCAEIGMGYNMLVNELNQREITLHVLRQTGIQLTSNRSPTSQIFGIDNKEVFIGQNKQEFDDVDIPSDYCASLALQSNGSVFDSGNLMDKKKTQQYRKFMDKFASRVQRTSAQCQLCTCELGYAGVAQSVCRSCESQMAYFKGLPTVLQYVIDYKNTLTNTVQTMVY